MAKPEWTWSLDASIQTHRNTPNPSIYSWGPTKDLSSDRDGGELIPASQSLCDAERSAFSIETSNE
jgi:hypothetical protein